MSSRIRQILNCKSLYYLRGRYYDPSTARFISEDPVGWASGQTNAYAYVGGNPVQFSDPSGLQAFGFPVPVGPMPGGRFGPRPPSRNDGIDGIFQDKTPNHGNPWEWHTNPGSGQERLYDSKGKPAVDIDWDHDHGQGQPHPHNWGPGKEREVPENGFSPWPRGRDNPAQCDSK